MGLTCKYRSIYDRLNTPGAGVDPKREAKIIWRWRASGIRKRRHSYLTLRAGLNSAWVNYLFSTYLSNLSPAYLSATYLFIVNLKVKSKSERPQGLLSIKE